MTPITITGLYTYPIKACGRLEHEKLEIGLFGPLNDRRWMVTDDRGIFVTQREMPRLALIQPSFDGTQLVLNATHMPTIRLWTRGTQSQVTVWRFSGPALDMGDDAADWLTAFMGKSLRLMYMPEDTVRMTSKDYTPEQARVSFADGYPILIASEEGLADLNARLAARGKPAVPMSRFRPNLVVKGGVPFVEDTWRKIRIGGMIFEVVKPCARCAVTTVDQSTAAIPDHEEPLATLATFRRGTGGVMFGQNVVHRGTGTLSLGDTVEVLEEAAVGIA